LQQSKACTQSSWLAFDVTFMNTLNKLKHWIAEVDHDSWEAWPINLLGSIFALIFWYFATLLYCEITKDVDPLHKQAAYECYIEGD
jgi:hypothetical protein